MCVQTTHSRLPTILGTMTSIHLQMIIYKSTKINCHSCPVAHQSTSTHLHNEVHIYTSILNGKLLSSKMNILFRRKFNAPEKNLPHFSLTLLSPLTHLNTKMEKILCTCPRYFICKIYTKIIIAQ